MLKLKLTQTVPDNAANMAFIRTPVLDGKNIFMIDRSTEIPANYAYVGKTRVMQTNGYEDEPWLTPDYDYYAPTLLSEDAVVISTRSVMHPDIAEPRPLYYKHRLGCGPRQLSGRRYIMICDQAPFDLDEARLELRKNITIYDDTGREATDLSWDVEADSIYSEGTEDIGFNVNIWTDKHSYAGRSYFVKYKAYNTTNGETTINYLEALNAQPNTPEELGIHFSRQVGHMGWKPPFNLSDPATAYAAPGIAIFPPEDPNLEGTLVVSYPVAVFPAGGPIEVIGPGGAPVITITEDQTDSIRDVVAEINKYPYLKATTLTPSDQLVLQGNAAGLTFEPAAGGTVVPQDTTPHGPYIGVMMHWMHRMDRRIRPLLPANLQSNHHWYPRITRGEFVELEFWEVGAVDYYGELIYSMPEICNYQDYSPIYGPRVREVLDEPALRSGPKSIQVRQYPIHDFDSIIVTSDEKQAIYPYDADLMNGKIYFKDPISSTANLRVSYAYDAGYEYQGIDLNPVHNPDILGKYVGIYIIPKQIRTNIGAPGGTDYTWIGTETDITNLEGYCYMIQGPHHEFNILDMNGVCPCDTSDENCLIYFRASVGGKYFRAYKDKFHQHMIAELIWVGANPTTGNYISLHPVNGSGFSCLIEMGGPLTDGEWVIHVEDNRRTIRHIVADSVREIEDILDGMATVTLKGNHAITLPRLLAIFQVAQTADTSDITLLDTRTRGGGIREDITVKDKEEARMYWDIANWDGTPFQSAGAVVTTLPTGIVPGTGAPYGVLPCNVDPSGWMSASNYLTREEIDDKIKRYIAAGIYPLLDFSEEEE